jgi:phage terminase small subunit
MKAVVLEYFRNGFDKEKAMRKHGYNTVHTFVVFARPDVQEYIEERMRKMAEKAELNAEWVLKRWARYADAPLTLAKYRKVAEDGSLYYDFTGATEDELALITEMAVEMFTDGKGDDAREVRRMKIGIVDPKAALDSIAKHLGMFKEKIEISGGDVASAILAGRERAKPKVEESGE